MRKVLEQMTEEIPEVDVDRYKFPDKYLEDLREYEDQENNYYNIVMGGLWRAMQDDCRFSDEDAWSVNRLLQDREVDEAEDYIYERLEE